MDRILVGLDASPRAAWVLQRAVELARRGGGKVLLFRAVGIPVGIPHEAYSMSPASLADLLESEAKRYLEQAATKVPPELLLGTVIGVGTPWQAICAAADHNDELGFPVDSVSGKDDVGEGAGHRGRELGEHDRVFGDG